MSCRGGVAYPAKLLISRKSTRRLDAVPTPAAVSVFSPQVSGFFTASRGRRLARRPPAASASSCQRCGTSSHQACGAPHNHGLPSGKARALREGAPPLTNMAALTLRGGASAPYKHGPRAGRGLEGRIGLAVPEVAVM